MERIANSAPFVESERLRRFLRFTVEATLRGEHDRLKEYVLGREVFDRKDGYDPRLDPIVRVEARRLRSRLSDYYSGPGRTESFRIAYPKGSYVPVFTAGDETRAPTLRRRGLLFAAGLSALSILGFFGAYAYRSVSTEQPSALAVLPAQWIWRNEQGLDSSAIGLSEALDAEIANRNLARVIAWPIAAARHGALRSTANAASQLGASRLLAVSVRPLDGGELITIFLIDSKSGEKLRAEHYFIRDVSSYWVQTKMAQRIAGDLHDSGRL
ncbi:MAG TPA: hypothetical protein VKT72_17180 [Candidatus Baltobacteraceae bacterium]|nr:hypothetical protein [Candidatus Baltobacteraceae bacterium]